MGSVSDLGQLQRWMQEVITHPTGIDPDGVDETILPSPTLTPVERLAIYNRSYHARLLDCFRSVFPALRHSLGDELFEQFARAYLHAHPPASFTLARVADAFPRWLEETRPEGEESWVAFIVELATFELAYREVYDGVTQQRAFRFRHPVHRYQDAVRRGETPELPPPELSFVLLCLRNDRVVVHELSQLEYELSLASRRGR